MSPDRGRPILVTGGIRTGTTWVGRILAASGDVGLIQEPFNVAHRMGVFTHRWARQFTYLTSDNCGAVFDALERSLDFRYSPWAQLRSIRNLRNAAGFLRDWPRTLYRRLVSRPRPLLKDPIALFSAEQLAARFEMDVVVLIRHPGAFAWSYKRIGEPDRFADLAAQPELLDGPLAPFREQILELAGSGGDALDQAILMWNLFHHVIARYRDSHATWVFKRHEDLSLAPEVEFRDVFERVGLPFSDRVRRELHALTSARNPAEARNGVRHDLRRNSRESLQVWTRRLNPGEIDRVRRGTATLAEEFYDDSTWP